MNTTSSASVQVAQKPEWLEAFLGRTYFDPCVAHDPSKDHLNHYCINCDTSVCGHCTSSEGFHGEHDTIKLYKHVGQSAVRITDMNKYFNCSMIQPYRCNKHAVVALLPLPHKGSSGQASCQICSRRLINTDYNYCSISCKVQASSSASHDHDEDGDKPVAEKEAGAETSKKRKGVPHRAPRN